MNFLLLQMTSNLVNFTSATTELEVNNNNDNGKAGKLESLGSHSPSASTTSTASTTEIDDIEPHSIYSLNDTCKIVVNSPEEWLCVARLPLDFTQTEFESLLQDYGPVQQCFLIHSEISGKLTKCRKDRQKLSRIDIDRRRST